MTYNNGVRHISARYDVIRNGAVVTHLYPKTAATITMVSSAQLKTYITGTFVKNDEIDLLNDHICPYLIIDGIAYPMGEYIVSVAESIIDDSGESYNIEAYDLSLVVSQNRIEKRLSIESGKKYIDAIQELLLECGITKVIADESSDVLQSVREDWEVGTSYIDIINDLLSEINFNAIWFDFNGFARLQKYVAPSASNIDFEYKSDELSILSKNASSTLDIYDAPNVFVAEVSNPDFPEPMRAVSVNDDPGSILSTIRRGRRIVAPLERLNNIASQEALQEYVDAKKLKSMLSTDTISFDTALEHGHNVGNIISIDHPVASGIYQETEWSMMLSAGQLMRHKARRIVYI